MYQIRRQHKLLILGILVLNLAVACSGNAGDDASPATESESSESVQQDETSPAIEQPTDEQADSSESISESSSDDANVSESEISDDQASADGEASTGETTADKPETEAQGATGPIGELDLSWNLVQIDEGIKPAFDLDANGNAHLAYLTEEEMGGIFYATNSSGDFDIENVAQGYFYGPVDLALGSDGTPFIAYHDHQDTGFDPNLGDEVVAILRDGNWELVTVEDVGHDGWDNSIFVDGDGNWHTVAIDPAQFGSQAGVEYATNAGGGVKVSQVGSGPIVYEFGTSIQLDNDGLPGIAYYDQDETAQAYARFDGNQWTVELVDQNGDAGRYSNLIYDTDNNPHISYYVFDGETTGDVRHAWWDGSEWQIENVDRLEDVRQGRVGARKITALALDAVGNLHIAYTDRGRVVYGQQSEEGWVVQELPKNSDKILGQLVELKLDGNGNPHLVWYEVTVFAPTLTGDIIYASGSG